MLGDSGNGGLGGSNGNRARKVRDAFEDDNGGPHADLVLMLGDNAYPDGKDEEYQDALFENMYEETLRNSALFPVVGNHEIDGTTITNSIYQTGTYYDIFTLPRAGEAGGRRSGTEAYYSFDYGNIHFICLESITPEGNTTFADAMEGWLAADLVANSKEWIIALWHHPPYSFGTHNTDNASENESEYMREDDGILETLEDNGVDLVLVGHSHCYERTMFINGHYSESDDYDDSVMEIDSGDGDPAGDGAYKKDAQNRGTVYVLAGSASKSETTTFDEDDSDTFYPAMSKSFSRLGSVKIEVSNNGNKLDVYFIGQVSPTSNTYGQIDHFRLIQY
ncbi:MAG: hypothetical protein SCALA701_08330 [Candidatus Scalindua sp.]|nr:MAG: hypothetical protein SCALA701_08330 [Candidatus Scalindua sp.]